MLSKSEPGSVIGAHCEVESRKRAGGDAGVVLGPDVRVAVMSLSVDVQ